MGYRLNNKIRELVPYEPINGDYSVRLDANESFLEMPMELYQKALLKLQSAPVSRYPDSRAVDLCKAFARCYDVPFETVMAGNGSDEVISIIVGAFFEQGEELVTLSNDFSMYRFYADVYGVKASVFPKNEKLKIDVDKLIDYIKRSGAAGVIFSNPCNPTSLCLSKGDVLRLCKEVDCLVVVDEAYMDFASSSVIDEVCEFDNLIVLKTCSKAVGLAAIRLGFAVSNPTITNALLSVKSPYNVNSLSAAIGEAVLSDTEYLSSCVQKIIFSRDQLYNELLKLHIRSHVFDEVYRTQTNFVFIKTNYSKAIFKALCRRGIVVREFDGFLRITAGTRVENEKLITATEEIVTAIMKQGV